MKKEMKKDKQKMKAKNKANKVQMKKNDCQPLRQW